MAPSSPYNANAKFLAGQIEILWTIKFSKISDVLEIAKSQERRSLFI